MWSSSWVQNIGHLKEKKIPQCLANSLLPPASSTLPWWPTTSSSRRKTPSRPTRWRAVNKFQVEGQPTLFFFFAEKQVERRVPERWLYACAACGGWPGGACAMLALSHKTSKRSFLVRYAAAALAHLFLLYEFDLDSLHFGKLLWWHKKKKSIFFLLCVSEKKYCLKSATAD